MVGGTVDGADKMAGARRVLAGGSVAASEGMEWTIRAVVGRCVGGTEGMVLSANGVLVQGTVDGAVRMAGAGIGWLRHLLGLFRLWLDTDGMSWASRALVGGSVGSGMMESVARVCCCCCWISCWCDG